MLLAEETYFEIITNDFLEHHGIKGMQWGVRKREDTGGKEPKTVSDEKQAKREAKAKKLEFQAEQVQKQINLEWARTPKTSMGRSIQEQRIADLTKAKNELIANAAAKRQGKLTADQKRLLIGGAIAVGFLGSKILMKEIQSGELNRQKMIGEGFLGNRTGNLFKTKADLFKQGMNEEEIMSKVVKDINPDFEKWGGKTNCRRCTFAYEMRRRGFDVAATRSSKGTGQDPLGFANALSSKSEILTKTGLIKSAIKDANEGKTDTSEFLQTMPKWGKEEIPLAQADLVSTLRESLLGKSSSSSKQVIFDTLAKQPNGARGELGVGYLFGSGHSMAWEVIDGKPVIFDTQIGKAYHNIGEMDPKFLDMINQAGFTRLDNIPLNENFLLRWLKDAR